MNEKIILPTIYLSGPQIGIPGNIFSEFKLVEEKLIELGLRVLIPNDFFEHIDTVGFKQNDFMRERVKRMMEADIILTLENWEHDRDCKNEVIIARLLDIPVKHIVTFISTYGKASEKI